MGRWRLQIKTGDSSTQKSLKDRSGSQSLSDCQSLWLNARRANPLQTIFGIAGMQSCLGKERVLLQDLKTGHFYFGKNRTFLNWLDTPRKSYCKSEIFGLEYNHFNLQKGDSDSDN